MEKKKFIPVPDPDTTEIEYTGPSACSGDMTGLIPANNSPETESDSYKELYPYIPEC